MDSATNVRVARPTDDIEALLPFYRDGLGLAVLARFEDHDGFDGVVLGRADQPYHLEFTSARGHVVGRAPTKDHLLVFYIADEAGWWAACGRMTAVGFAPVPSFNPYWDRHGQTFEDPDGYRVVLQRGSWRA